MLRSFGFIITLLFDSVGAPALSNNLLVLRFDAPASRRKDESGDLVTIQQEISRTTAVGTVVACSRPGPMNLEDPAGLELRGLNG